MDVLDIYSFNGGLEIFKKEYKKELLEVVQAIRSVDGNIMKTKESKEKTMPGKMLYSPVDLNKAILTNNLYKKGWKKPRIKIDSKIGKGKNSYIEADGAKNNVGLEVQFGKYAFLGWDILGKMVIFAENKDYKAGIEVVPVKSLQSQMSTGVGSFTQIVNILEKRGVSDKDIPVLILGIGRKKHKDKEIDKMLGIN